MHCAARWGRAELLEAFIKRDGLPVDIKVEIKYLIVIQSEENKVNAFYGQGHAKKKLGTLKGGSQTSLVLPYDINKAVLGQV